MRAVSYLLALIGLLSLAIPALAEIGHVEVAHGDVTITKLDGSQQKAKAGLGLDVGDQLTSAAGAWAVLQMMDGASLTVRPATLMRIDDYRYDEQDPSVGSVALRLLKGALRSITGLVGKQNPTAYSLNTPTATIGIRGTDHETVVVDESTAQAGQQPGTYDSVNAGQTVMHSTKGDVTIEPGKVGFFHARGERAPAMLAQRPRFFERIHQFDSRQGIYKVLGRLHASLGNGAFEAFPDLKERMRKVREQRAALRASRKEERVQRREARQAEREAHPLRKRRHGRE